MFGGIRKNMMDKHKLDKIINSIREEMAMSLGGGGAGYKGSGPTDSGTPTAGYDPALGYDGRKKKYKKLNMFYKDSIKSIQRNVRKSSGS